MVTRRKTMKITKHISLLMTISLIMGFSILAKNTLKVDAMLEPVDIGLFAIVEPVSTQTKIYIDYEDKEFVESTGREVFAELNSVIDPILPPIGPAFVPPEAMSRYYYYAYPNGLGEITDIVMLKNDYDSVKIILDYLLDKALELYPTNFDYANEVIGYIREISKSYSSSANNSWLEGQIWKDICGTVTAEFINSINSDYSHGLRAVEYFAAFIDYGNFNTSLHGNIPEQYRRTSSLSDNYPSPLYFIDPATNNQYIDLIHMFASLDGCYSLSGASLSIVRTLGFLNNAYHKDFVSYAGDLQTAASYYQNAGMDISQFDDFSDIMNDPNSTCSSADIYADIDAFGIAHSNLNTSYNPVTSFINYYEYIILDSNRRFYLFQDYILIEYNQTTPTHPSVPLILEKIYEILAIDVLSDGTLTSFNINYLGKYTLMNSANPSFEIRKKIADLFYYFVIGGY